ncbi:MAG: dienelactone hydrolase family protein [Deltaproteobacteria bacterium]|nr:dienelactone hydrolase family protein [Deltaproteobacteria bacterium]
MAESSVTTSTIQIAWPTCSIRAFEARPSGAGPHPAVIVIQEWWGLNDHIKDVATRFAREGYVAVAPDLYSRLGNKVATNPDDAGKLMTSLDKPDGVADLQAVVAHLNKAPGIKADRIGVTGFCMGGSYTTLLACSGADVKAAVAFYGEIPDEATLAKLNCPLLYIYGSEDFWIQRNDVDRLAATLKTLSKPGEVKIYDGAPHAFFNDTRRDVYRPKEAADAWQRTLALFAKQLKTA